MVVCYAKQASLSGGEDFMRRLAIRHGASITDMMVGAGIYVEQLAQILVGNGLKVDANRYAQAEFIAKALVASESKPVIFHVGWFKKDLGNNWRGNGGHWVVCIGAVNGNAVFLDPWYGLIEAPILSLPQYNPVGSTPDMSTTRSVGILTGWLVRVV
jgi:hypothetical protein